MTQWKPKGIIRILFDEKNSYSKIGNISNAVDNSVEVPAPSTARN